MRLVAGIDSSTQACKVTVRDRDTGLVVREAKAGHPPQTILDPQHWWDALLKAVQAVGGLEDVEALSISGQQHTPIFLDSTGATTFDSPLWNDTGSHPHVLALNAELGREEWIRRTGLPITLSDTVVKLRWLRDLHPSAADRTVAVAVVHDWLTWRLRGFGPGNAVLENLTTDRSEASGTGYWSGQTEDYCIDLVEHAFGRPLVLPRVLGPWERAGITASGIPGIPEGISIGVGSGDNAAAALALGVADGDAVMSLGTSGVVYARTTHPVHDFHGYVCSYADATGHHLPLVATLNAARNLHAGAAALGCSYDELSELALRADPGAQGLTLLPYFEGERTPDLPQAKASVHNATLANFTRENLARAIVEGTLANQVSMIDALRACDVYPDRLILIGGAAKSPAVQEVLTQMVDLPVTLPAFDEYVAKGAAMQAALALDGVLPEWRVKSQELAPTPTQPQIADQHSIAQRAMGYAGLGPALPESTTGTDHDPIPRRIRTGSASDAIT